MPVYLKAFENLTPKQRDVLTRILSGETDNEIADQLKIKPSTVRKHVERIYRVFDFTNNDSDDRRSRRGDCAAGSW